MAGALRWDGANKGCETGAADSNRCHGRCLLAAVAGEAAWGNMSLSVRIGAPDRTPGRLRHTFPRTPAIIAQQVRRFGTPSVSRLFLKWKRARPGRNPFKSREVHGFGTQAAGMSWPGPDAASSVNVAGARREARLELPDRLMEPATYGNFASSQPSAGGPSVYLSSFNLPHLGRLHPGADSGVLAFRKDQGTTGAASEADRRRLGTAFRYYLQSSLHDAGCSGRRSG